MSLKSKFQETKLRLEFRLQLKKLPKEVMLIFIDEIYREIAIREKKGEKK